MTEGRVARQEKRKIKGGIFGRIMKAILLPFIVLLVGVGLLTMFLVKGALYQAKETEMENVAGLNSSKVETYFTKYQEMARNMAANHGL